MGLRLLGVAGSLRRESFNRALLHAAIELAPDGMTIRTLVAQLLAAFADWAPRVGTAAGATRA